MSKFYRLVISNTSTLFDTEDSKLRPLVELIIVTTEPRWVAGETKIEKKQIADEFRFNVTEENVDNLINFLQKTKENMATLQGVCDKTIIKTTEI